MTELLGLARALRCTGTDPHQRFVHRVAVGLGVAAPSRDMPGGTPPTPMDILVVEDNATNRLVLEAMLEHEGHRVRCAPDGAQAVEKAAAQRAALDAGDSAALATALDRLPAMWRDSRTAILSRPRAA